jgi:hypothetical protein
MQHRLPTYLFKAVFIIALIAFIGCEKKTDQQNEMSADDISADTISAVTPPSDSESEPDGEVKITIPDVTGTWSGTFDKRATILNITEQTDSSFSGKITINYREVINQEVNGMIHPSSMKMTMADQLHSRYRGKYNGTLSDDGKNFSGNFTMDLDGSKFSFNLIKK